MLRDRATGAVWRNTAATIPVYMASTSKLAMAVTLVVRNQEQAIHLSGRDWATLHRMLHVSPAGSSTRSASPGRASATRWP